MGVHGSVAAVARTAPGVKTLGNDGAGQQLVLVVHEAGKVLVAVQRRLVTDLISHEGEQGVHIFRLVVGPDGCIV